MPLTGLLYPALASGGRSRRDILVSPRFPCACARRGNYFHFHRWLQRQQSLRQPSLFPDRSVRSRSSGRRCRGPCAKCCPLSNARWIVSGRGSGQFRRRAREWLAVEARAPPPETGLRRGRPMEQRSEILPEKSAFLFLLSGESVVELQSPATAPEGALVTRHLWYR